MEMKRPSNSQIIKKYINRFKYSNGSMKTRKSALNYFFDKKYFGFKGHIFNIDTDILIDYFDHLKQLNKLSLGTKQTKWILMVSFLKYCMEYYRKYNFIVGIPKDSISWNGFTHKQPKSNKDIVMSKEEVKQILEYCKLTNFYHYLIFRIFAETGVRKTGLINLDYDKIDIEKRYLVTIEKFGKEVIYYFSKDLAKHLRIYLEERKSKIVNTKALFLSTHLKRFSERPFNVILKIITKTIGIKKNITCHTFRRSLNTLRFKMDCPDRMLKILLNHTVKNVTYNSYVKLNYEEFLGYYDDWYPYKDIQI